jgi:hypothetical protein
VTIIPAVVAWAFTLTFIIALVLVLLDVAGMRRIRDRVQRKWLFRSLFGSVILAVVGFGSWQFEALKGGSGSSARPAGTTEATATAPTPFAPAPPAPAQPDRPRPTPLPVPAADFAGQTIPEEVRAWAEQALGARPVLSAVVEGHYPACAEQLRARPMADIARSDANACREELNRFNDTRLVAYYDLKRPYDRNLEDQGEALGEDGLTSEEVPQFNYVRAEIRRLNGEEWDRLMEFQRRYQVDLTRCSRTRCSAGASSG